MAPCEQVLRLAWRRSETERVARRPTHSIAEQALSPASISLSLAHPPSIDVSAIGNHDFSHKSQLSSHMPPATHQSHSHTRANDRASKDKLDCITWTVCRRTIKCMSVFGLLLAAVRPRASQANSGSPNNGCTRALAGAANEPGAAD